MDIIIIQISSKITRAGHVTICNATTKTNQRDFDFGVKTELTERTDCDKQQYFWPYNIVTCPVLKKVGICLNFILAQKKAHIDFHFCKCLGKLCHSA